MQTGYEWSPGNLLTRLWQSKISRRIGTRPKRRYCATPGSSFVVRIIRGTVSFYAVLPREAEAMVARLTVHAAANAVAPYDCKHAIFLTNGP
ncbi:hypothetical protein TNCV_802061 [Trichonephila clavipes]|nr:hypothetical protein TNCV_802061 [Trichonephila clavipes]